MEYVVQSQSLTQVANAIREKTRDPALLEFPDEFVVAIRSIQPQQTDVIGGTVGWNQLAKDINTTDYNIAKSTLSQSGNKSTLTFAEAGALISTLDRTVAKVRSGHIFIVQMVNADASAMTTNYRLGCTLAQGSGSGTTNELTTNSPFYIGRASYDYCGASCYFPLSVSGQSFSFDGFQLINLTTLLGSTIADKIYTLEQSTPGAGVTIIKQLLTKDYYPYSLPDLSSIMYANDWENFGDSYILNGFLRLSNNSLYRWGDILANGNVTRKTARITMTDLTWTSGTMAAYEATLPNWVGSNAVEPILETVISDAYPTALYDVWSGLNPTDLSAAPDRYLYQIYESQSPDTKYYKIYIKDTSIATVSDLMTALAGKEIVYAISDENYAVAGKRYRGRADINLPDARTMTFGDDPEYAYFYRRPGVEQTVTQIIVTATKVSYINENGNEIEVARIDSGLQWDGDDYGQLIWFGDNAPDMSPEDYEWFISLYEEVI